MSAVLKSLKGYESWKIEYIDIESDVRLKEEYGTQIPVMYINGRKAFKSRVSKAQLEKKIMKAKELNTGSSSATSLAEDETFVPAAIFQTIFFVLIGVAFSYFIYEGFVNSQTGIRAKLLRVENRKNQAVTFNLEKLKGGKLALSELEGKVVFLNFWATWCPPCIEEMPSIRRLHEKVKNNSNIIMLLVSADESWAPVKKFFGEEGSPFTVLLDPEGEIAKQYGTTRFPETFIVIDGKIQAFIEGPRDWDTWYAEAYLNSFLEG